MSVTLEVSSPVKSIEVNNVQLRNILAIDVMADVSDTLSLIKIM